MNQTTDAARTGKRIVIFADGTGNAFTHQESNVWRLYSHLDLTRGDQIARYIAGVGTQSIGLLAKLDGAIGFGVPGNVRELYRFICWNWEPEDEIHLIGFSRGSFTVRTLAGLIENQGLLPREIAGKPVKHEDMETASEFAWRAYRAQTTGGGLWSGYFFVALTRWLLALVHSSFGGARPYDAAREALARPENAPRRAPKIRFLGVFDTVEAYGVPFEELKPFVDRLVFPIRFKTRKCCELVEQASHALSLDDERTAFHPVRFDRTDDPNPGRIREVWFAGMHSDVGGGYPDDTLARIPLVWMAREAEGAGLRFQPGAIAGWESTASPRGELHDSRAGLSVMYRYAPRPIGTGKADGGLPVLHASVAEKIADRSNNYAPLNVPDQVAFLMPPPKPKPKEVISTFAVVDDAETALDTCPQPNAAILESARDVVWWRRAHYFALVFLLAVLAGFPWMVERTNAGIAQIRVRLASHFAEDTLKAVDEVGFFLKGPLEFIGTFLPGMARPWLEAFIAAPLVMGLLIALAWWMYSRSCMLQQMIHDYAVLAWRVGDDPAPDHERLPSMDFARKLRTSDEWKKAYRVMGTYVIPTLVSILAVTALLTLLSRNTVDALTKSGRLCHDAAALEKTDRLKRLGETAGWPLVKAGAAITIDTPFNAASPCWATGVRVSKGITYQLTIKAPRHFLDRARVSGLAGFTDRTLLGRHGPVSSMLLKRWHDAPWFQFVHQIGANDLASAPLQAVNGLRPTRHKPSVEVAGADWGGFQPYTLLDAATKAKVEQSLAAVPPPAPLVARFEAKASGPLYLYLNDAMAGLPLVGIIAPFYRNNAGEAEVSIEVVNAGP